MVEVTTVVPGMVVWVLASAVTTIAALSVIVNLLFKNKHDFFMLRAASHRGAVSGAPIAVFAWWAVGHLMIFIGLLPAFALLEWGVFHLAWLLPLSIPISILLGATTLAPFTEKVPRGDSAASQGRRSPEAYALLGCVLVAASWLLLLFEAYALFMVAAPFAILCLILGAASNRKYFQWPPA